MRVLHCLRAPVGGLFRHVRDLARAQRRNGYAVGIICDANAQDSLTAQRLAALEMDLDLGIHRVAMARGLAPSDFSAAQRIRGIVSDLAPDILHGHGAKGGAYARLAVGGIHVRLPEDGPAVVYTPHGGSLHYSPWSPAGFIFLALERRLARATSGIVFESDYSRRVYAEHVGAVPCATVVVPNGLLPEEFGQHLPIDGARDLLFVGELRHLKGVDTLLHALAKLNQDQGRRVTTRIVGEGPDGDAFRSLADQLGLADVVTFDGAMPAADAFPTCRFLVVPSRAESLPYIVLEAAAQGLPMLATRVGGIPEIVSETDTPLLPPDDPDALADAIAQALVNPGARAQAAQQLQARVKKRFTVDAMCNAIGSFYQNARQTTAVPGYLRKPSPGQDGPQPA
ncbi:MAG: glycosyltransferase family 4 protein [Pseudomonadota bacterium]